MATVQKSLGSLFERAILRTLRTATDTPAAVCKPPQSSWKDVGDIHAGPFALQLKSSTKGTKTIAGYHTAARKQAGRADLPYAGAVITPDGTASSALVIIDIQTFSTLLETYLYCSRM